MSDATDLVKLIKQAALEAVASIKPVNIFFGEVVNTSPLKINVEQKMTLGENQLILSRNVTDFEIEASIGKETEVLSEESKETINNTVDSSVDIEDAVIDSSYSHILSERKRITVHNGLVVGEHVILIRQQEGQKFIVMDRIGR